jgi:tetratricopeptide (TPR) repeat protein
MKTKQVVLIAVLLISTLMGFAQNQAKIDSLKFLIASAKQDTNQVKALNTLAYKYQRINLDTSLIYAEQSLELALLLNFKTGVARSYTNIGFVHLYQGDYDKTLEYWKKSLKTLEEIGDKDGIAIILVNIGLVYSAQSNYHEAIEYYKKALRISEELGDKDEIARNLGNIGLIFMYQSNYTKAIEYYQKSLKICEEIGDKKGIAINLGNIGIIYHEKSNYPKALEYYQKALEINEEIGDKNGIAVIFGNIGIIYKNQSNYLNAIEYYQKALKISEELGDKEGIGTILGNIGVVYADQSNYPKAIEYYQKALKIREELGDKDGIAINLANIGIVYADQSNYPKAMEYYQKALKIGEEIGDKNGIAKITGNIGIVYMFQSNYPKALEHYQKALEINEEIGDKSSIASNLGNIGIVYYNQSNYPKAIEYYQKTLKISEEIGDKKYMSESLGNIGKLHNSMKEYNKAIDYSNKALKISREIGIVYINPYNFLSTSYWALNQKSKAAMNLDTILNIDNNSILLNFSVLPENAKQLYFSGVEEDYWKYNSFVLQNADSFPSMVERVYNNTIKNKGLLLKSNTAMRNAIYSSKDSVLMQDYDNWIVLKRQIAKKYSKGEDATQLENKADSLEGYLVKNSNEFSDFKKTQKINWKQVQANLKENELAIEFTNFPLLNPDSSYTDFTNQVQYVALILSKNSKQPKMIPLFEEKQLEKIIGKFGGNNYSYINSIYGKNTEVNKQLYNLIWAPIDNYLDSVSVTQSDADTKRTIYLSPSGLLHKISFSAIAKEQNVYLCDAYNIETKSSTSKITEQSKGVAQSNAFATATLFGGITYDTDSTRQKIWNYLEGTKTETQKIDKILKKGEIKVNYFTNKSATEEEFKLMASNSNILHIATHGFFYPDPNKVAEDVDTLEVAEDIIFRGGSRGFGVNSFVESRNPLMRSGLVFAGANDVWSKQTKNDSIDDGVLTAQEVSSIDMRKTNLVVMSACETGLGDIKGSEGVYGLQRAFKMAGVDFMIMSLWQVPDKETEEFMTTFYKKLMKSKDIKISFAKTQKEMRKRYDPYFWAAFVLIE